MLEAVYAVQLLALSRSSCAELSKARSAEISLPIICIGKACESTNSQLIEYCSTLDRWSYR